MTKFYFYSETCRRFGLEARKQSGISMESTETTRSQRMMVTALLMLMMATATPAAMGSSSGKPHIIFILADDMGWADTSFHGSPQIPTPNLDALAADGVVLSSHYAQSVCAPSRAALLTGLYPLRFGLDWNMLYPSAPGGLPLNVTLLPEHLRNLGYKSHMVGKWHLGCSTWSHTPTNRGFDSHVGYLNHGQDYATHTVTYNGSCGYDFWFNEQLLTDAYGVYSMDVFLNRAKSIIRHHDASEPLFLFFSMQAPHIGTGDRYFLPPEENVRKFLYIGDKNRIGYAATLDTMDQATGAVVEALYEKGMLDDSLVIFSSDNGPDPIGMGSSWPLRGSKGTLWEGGVRVPAFIWSPLLSRSSAEGHVSWDLMHMVDWMPTLYQAAGGDIEDLGPIDGVSQWGTLSRGEPSARQELLHGFDPADGSGAYRSGRYKLVVAPSDGSWKDGRFPPAGNISSDVNVDQLTADSAAAKTLAKFYSTKTTRAPSPRWRGKAAVSCREDEQGNFRSSDSPYLFDVVADPCEMRNLATERRELVESIKKKLVAAASIAVPQSPSSPKPEAYPEYNNCTWGPRQDIPCNKDNNVLLCPVVETSVAAGPFYGSFLLTVLLSLCLVYVLRHFAL